MNVIITGYYYHQNLGDDLFEAISRKIFLSNKFSKIFPIIKYVRIEDLYTSEYIKDCSRIILFGGETLNDYFLDRLLNVWLKNKSIKFNAIGVSTNQDYDTIVNKINLFDTVLFRNKLDYEYFKNRINCFYGPDIVFLLNNNGITKFIHTVSIIKQKQVGFFLSQTVLLNLSSEQQKSYLKNISNVIKFWINNDYIVNLFPMCTNNKIQEDDNIINKKVYNLLTESEKRKIRSHTTNIEIVNKIKSMSFNICWRFHAHILSIINHIPFLSISRTNKVKNLLEENFLTELYASDFEIIEKCKYLIYNKNKIIKSLKKVHKNNKKDTTIYMDQLIYLDTKLKNIFYVNPNTDYEIIYKNLYEKYNKIKSSMNDSFNTTIIIFTLMRSLHNDYTYGLNEKIYKGIHHLKNDICWLIEDNIRKQNFEFFEAIGDLLGYKFERNVRPNEKINIKYINQNDLAGLHRSGWQSVVNSLDYYNSSNDLICDLYLDRTFHWNSSEYNKLGVIPYKQNWIGVIHHTTDTEYSDYNTIALFKNKYFVDSLPYCKGLFVLSQHLQKEIIKILFNMKIQINIYALIHPTEFVDSKLMFTPKNFIMNPKKKIIQVGAWMRKISAIFELNLGENELYLQKAALKGKNMESYYNSIKYNNDDNDNNFEDNIHIDIINNESIVDDNKNISIVDDNKNISRDNKIRNINKLDIDSVEMIEYLQDGLYDELLSKNIIFVNLIGASAVNTVIECIVRNTPIIINKLPAIVELLGENYPLYYNNIDDVHKLLSLDIIDKAYSYIKNLDKTKFKLETFVKEFITIVDKIKSKIEIEKINSIKK